MLRPEVDELVCILTPEPFYAIGAHYADFSQVSDEEVVRLLDEAEQVTTRSQEPEAKSEEQT